MARTIKPIASRLTCTEEMLDYLSYLSAENGSTNKDERLKMAEFIRTAMQIELTQRQRRCITEYYLNNKGEVILENDKSDLVTRVNVNYTRGYISYEQDSDDHQTCNLVYCSKPYQAILTTRINQYIVGRLHKTRSNGLHEL